MKQQDAIALLKADHKKVKGLFAETEALSDRATTQLQRLGEQICDELTVHTEVEEQIFYPAVRERVQRGHKDEKELLLESYEEHALAKTVIGELQQIDGGDESYRAKLNVLHELVETHVRDEERHMFPAVRELMGEDELKQLGQRISELKSQRQRAMA